MFLPIHRVERVNQDESVGSVRALADLFKERVGKDVWTYLGLEPGLPAGGAVRGDWMSFEDVEADYIERVLEECGSARAAAAEILGLTEEGLNEKLS